ncbi:MAG: hypothetical protein KGQ60_17745, partial [Planctomycetes bacterium]|nr:hypothetical protein [Planctomycetota bacterium]
FSLLLWGLCGIRLQNVSYDLFATIAISENRLSSVDRLVRSQDSNRYTVIAYKRQHSDSEPLNPSSFQTARIQVRVHRYSDLMDVERYLDDATRPEGESAESREYTTKLLVSKWCLESMQHLAGVLESDRLAQSETEPIENRSVIRMVGFQSEDIKTSPIAADLANECDGYRAQIAQLTTALDRSRSHSVGFLSISGKPRIFPVIEPIGWDRLLILFTAALSIWMSVAVICNGQLGSISGPIRKTLSGLKFLHSTNRSRSENLGIPCLGTIRMSASASTLAVIPHARDRCLCIVPAEVKRIGATNLSEKRLQLLTRLMLGSWLTVLLARLLLDGQWFELFCASPLAGMNCLMSGVP